MVDAIRLPPNQQTRKQKLHNLALARKELKRKRDLGIPIGKRFICAQCKKVTGVRVTPTHIKYTIKKKPRKKRTRTRKHYIPLTKRKVTAKRTKRKHYREPIWEQ